MKRLEGMILESQDTTPSDRAVTSNKHIKVSLGRRAGRIERMVVRTLGLLTEHHGPHKSSWSIQASNQVLTCTSLSLSLCLSLSLHRHLPRHVQVWCNSFTCIGAIFWLNTESDIHASRQQFRKKPDKHPKDLCSEGKNHHTGIKFHFD